MPRPDLPVSPWRRLGLVVFGLLTVVYGLLVMSLRPAAPASVALLAGIGLVMGGMAQFGLAPEVAEGWRWLVHLGGLVGIAGGLVALLWPGPTLLVLALVAAWTLVVNGLVRIAESIMGRARELWWAGLLAGVLELGLGLWAIGSPGRELLLLVNLVGIYLVVVGVDAILAAPSAGRFRI